jgi:hypothetical protein
LLIIDPIVAGMDTAFDAHKDQHVRAVLNGLAELAETADCAVVIVGHLNKTPSSEAYVRIANSVAFWNAARSVVVVAEDPDFPDDLRLVAQRKANYSRIGSVERHRIEEVVLPSTLDPETGDPITTSRMIFVEHAPEVDGDDVLASRSGRGAQGTAAIEFLQRSLADDLWHDSAGVKKLAAASQIPERTLGRAAHELRVETKRAGFPSVTHWRLPQSGQTASNGSGLTGAPASNRLIPASEDSSRTPLAPNGYDGLGAGVDDSNGRFCPMCTTNAECARRHSCRWVESLPIVRS